MMSASSDCASGRLGHLPAQQPGHHFDAGERVLQLVRDAGRHLAERRQAIAQPLALLELLDLRQVLEEHHRADRRRRGRRAPATACSRPPGRCPSAGTRRGSADGSSSNAPASDAHGVRALAQHVGERPADVVRAGASARGSGRPRRSSAPAMPSRRMAMMPFRMLSTMCRKKRSSGRRRRRSGAGASRPSAAGRPDRFAGVVGLRHRRLRTRSQAQGA